MSEPTNINNNNNNNNNNNISPRTTSSSFDGDQQQQGQQTLAASLQNRLNLAGTSPLRTLIRASSLQNLPSHSSAKEQQVAPVLVSPTAAVVATTKDKMDLITSDLIHPGPSSKYDFVKVKVRLEDHYYVLSRFLISRVLNVTKVDAADSVKISLELKKRLVDQGRLTLSQAELESELFSILLTYGYGAEYIDRYRMTTQFHHQRVPLIILISGPKCTGKSWLATQLAERLNLSTVLQTTLVQDLMDTIIREFNPTTGSDLFGMPSDPPIVFKNYSTKEELLTDFKKECYMIRHGVDTDIEKCFEEGKAIIIEGPHIDPNLFKELLEERTMKAPSPIQTSSDDSPAAPAAPPVSLAQKLKPKVKGIIIPFVLALNKNDHTLLVENWLSCSETNSAYAKKSFGDDPEVQTKRVVENLQTIQEYLCQGVPPFVRVDVNAYNFLETLDVMHSAVLHRINSVYSGHVKGFEYET
ncbi:hypothetical protein SAMD00019534_042240 [Acytostelium subglobosum LB1]|uniref:hypothetical protein n=1 Tax=Acytostelium subglobosum LB1 TaxID=1410327 RepID=UPI0006448DCF|nr:hypothetical protein SAMD00019534_042240 [Acytostelium subglobosum LB1]GAM21049.1 hypothetical protein SAMD00019534_042240 [Acytostelium subglobosum LB1]|eukprot:XP_012756183.1 hypothetical protein SAMD00019534_042240 [Acytostelium subglobosum LB1]